MRVLAYGAATCCYLDGRPLPVTDEHQRLGVSFPLIDGARSTSALGRRVFAAAASAVDPRLAARIAETPRWHRDYLAHLRELVVADLANEAGSEHDPLPRAGIDALRDGLTFIRHDDEVALRDALALPAGTAPATVVVDGGGQRARHLAVPYRARSLSGGELRATLDDWVARGVVEPAYAAALGRLIDEPDLLDLTGRTFVLIGAGAEMSPLAALCRWGATVVPLDLPAPAIWERILAIVREGSGRALVPVHSEPAGDDERALTRVAGFDVTHAAPELARWLAVQDGPMVVGSYAYADGADHLRVTMAADTIMEHLTSRRDDVSLAFLLTPTDVYAAPEGAVRAAQEAFARRSPAQRLTCAATGSRLFAPNYEDELATHDGQRFGIADCLVAQQGPNYALAKRAQRWRARVARADGIRVSANIAPATRTRSVTSNRVLAAAYAGASRFGVEVFDPATSATLQAALLVHDMHGTAEDRAPTVGGHHPLSLFAESAAHGGLWRQPFAPRSVLPVAAMRGLVRPRSTASPTV